MHEFYARRNLDIEYSIKILVYYIIMAASKCFNTIQPSQTSSDYSSQIRQTTIFTITNNSVLTNTFDGYKQNQFKIAAAPNNTFGRLIWADSYESLTDVNKGKTIALNEINQSYDVYNAPFYTIPSGNVYNRTVEDVPYDNCFFKSEEGHVPPFMSGVKIVPTVIPAIQNYIKSVNQKQIFNNSTVPRSIYFKQYCT